MADHFLNLRVLASEPIDEYALLSFSGREAISEPFQYTIELVTIERPDLSKWIGQHAEFDIIPNFGKPRVFSGRIYSARIVMVDKNPRILVHIGPAWQALAYARATHFIQDKSSTDILEAMTGDVTGLVKSVSVSPAAPKRGYAVRYDETELDFLSRLLAQDGIMYFFKYDRGSGNFRHKMIVTNKPADYIDIEVGGVHGRDSSLLSIARQQQASPRSQNNVSFNPNKLDTPFVKSGRSAETWGAVYSHDYETTGFEAKESGDLASRATASDQHLAQQADMVFGDSSDPSFLAGGRIELYDADDIVPKRVVLTSVVHTARDPWMLPGAGAGTYSNSFEALDAAKTWRPPVGQPDRLARGPVLGTIDDEQSGAGMTIVDKEWRVPVKIAEARDYKAKGLERFVWLPVQQQWAHSTHGAQFFPRMGARVIVDFLYGNPDLPFVAGTMYTPSQAYPFDPTQKATQSGWRSVTDGHGAVVQEFRFEDKGGSEEIYLFTDRDYRREIKHDDWGTIDNNQTLEVKKDRKRKVGGKETVDVTDTRTITVTAKNKLESKAEIELVVGASSIKMTSSSIEIKSPNITIKADAQLQMEAGGKASLKAPMTDVNADAKLTLKGGVVLIN